MPQVRFAPGSIRDLDRLREFLRLKNPIAAKRAGEVIVGAVRALCMHPQLGRPIEDMPDAFREWVIDFGDSGYIARYHIDLGTVTVLAIRHQKEVGWLD